MTDGSSQGLFVVVAVVIFGIFIALVYFLFGDTLTPALSSTFKDATENVMDILNDDSQSGEEVTYEEWVEDLKNIGYAVAEDSDFDGEVDGEFRYKGKDEKVIVPKIIKGVTITKATSMFSNNTHVNAVAINNPNVTDMSYMFYQNQSTSLDVSNLVTENVTNMSDMFRESEATRLDLSSFDTSNVTTMERMFMDSKATELDLSSFDTSKVKNMNTMFQWSKATKLDLSSFDTSNVTTMQNMFYNSKATSIDLSSFDTSKVKYMQGMFRSSQATILDLSSFDTSKVTSMSNMNNMFNSSQATTAYARTVADANKFNNSLNKPSTFTFVVKQQ